MFRYNETTYTIEDEERGLVVTQTAGPGHGVFAGSMRSNAWSFDFLISRSSDQFAGLTIEQLKDPSESARLRNADYQVRLHITIYPPTGEWDRHETPSSLAREAALARETGFYKTERSRIKSN
jgi:hypothetical protein